jgi:integrase
MVFSGQRLSTIVSLKTTDIVLKSNECDILLSTLQKTSKPGKHLKNLRFLKFEADKTLCVLSHLEMYLDVTKDIRSGQKLIISYCKPHKEVSVDTARRWIRSLLRKAGVDLNQFGVHSIRGATTSAVLGNGANLQDVMDSVSWASETTVARHYNKPIEKFNFGESVLKVL